MAMDVGGGVLPYMGYIGMCGHRALSLSIADQKHSKKNKRP